MMVYPFPSWKSNQTLDRTFSGSNHWTKWFEPVFLHGAHRCSNRWRFSLASSGVIKLSRSQSWRPSCENTPELYIKMKACNYIITYYIILRRPSNLSYEKCDVRNRLTVFSLKKVPKSTAGALAIWSMGCPVASARCMFRISPLLLLLPLLLHCCYVVVTHCCCCCCCWWFLSVQSDLTN